MRYIIELLFWLVLLAGVIYIDVCVLLYGGVIALRDGIRASDVQQVVIGMQLLTIRGIVEVALGCIVFGAAVRISAIHHQRRHPPRHRGK